MQAAIFWTFCTLLITLTLISSFGGGIRYRENFMQEMFDMKKILSNNTKATTVPNQLLEQLTFDQMDPMMQAVDDEMLSVGMVDDEVSPPANVVPKINRPPSSTSISSTPGMSVPTGMKTQDSGMAVPSSYSQVIEAFDGEMFAPF
jgi:hypothetical protein